MRFIGGKTELLTNIEQVIDENIGDSEVKSFCDIFSGTSSVGRYFKSKYQVYSNDIMYFSYVLQKATIENNEQPKFTKLAKIGIKDVFQYLETEDINIIDKSRCFIYNNYSPNENCNRMYLSNKNALRIDFIRTTIEEWKESKLISEAEYYYLLACLIEGVPYVSNISGTYGAYLKHWDKRTYNDFKMIKLDVKNNAKVNKCFNEDGNDLIKKIEGDIIYIDPPYNSRQYLPNYHLLETIALYDNPEIYGVTGLRPYNDIKSKYCYKKDVKKVFEALIKDAKFKHIIMSYSTDGIMSIDEIEEILKKYGNSETYKLYRIPYRKYVSKHKQESKELEELIFYISKEYKNDLPNIYNNKNDINCRNNFIKSPTNYVGGKYKILNQIIPLFPENINTFIDLFAGGFNVGINVEANKIICNDRLHFLIDIYKQLKEKDLEEILNHIDNRIKEFNLSKENEEGFLKFRKYYNVTKNPLDLYVLVCFSYNYQFRFNNNLEYNNPFGRNRSSFSKSMKEKLITFTNKLKSKNIQFTISDFNDLDIYSLKKNDFVYCDPPYLITTGSYNDGNRGFKDWKEEQEKQLLSLLDKLDEEGIKFALSNVIEHKGKKNSILEEWSKKYFINYINSNYSNSSHNTSGKSVEVLITNYETNKNITNMVVNKNEDNYCKGKKVCHKQITIEDFI